MANTRTAKEEMVTVGCKLPVGRTIHLKSTEAGVAIGPSITLNGMNSSRVIGGYGLTEVPADFWAQWLKENPKDPQVVNELLFAQDERDSAEAQALGNADLKTGLEPMDPTKPGQNLEPVKPGA